MSQRKINEQDLVRREESVVFRRWNYDNSDYSQIEVFLGGNWYVVETDDPDQWDRRLAALGVGLPPALEQEVRDLMVGLPTGL